MVIHRTIGSAIAAAIVFTVTTTRPARAADDCDKLGAATVATILGVPNARANPSAGHHKQPPDNMDVIGCSYVEATRDPAARSLVLWVYTPIAKDLASEYQSLSHPNVQGTPQPFSPGVGVASSGWVRQSVGGDSYDGEIVVRRAADIIVVAVRGMPSIDALKKSLAGAAQVVVKL